MCDRDLNRGHPDQPENTGIDGERFSSFLWFSTRSLPPCSLFDRSRGNFIGLTWPRRVFDRRQNREFSFVFVYVRSEKFWELVRGKS